MLEIKNIDVFYGDVQVIWDVSFNVNRGEIVALIGANGAGKSTILKTISGILRPKRGEILFEGKPIYKIDPFKLTEMGIAHVPEARRLFVEMTVEENLDMGSLRGEARVQREKTKGMVFDLLPRLKERRRQLAGTLSGGEQQMLAIARSLMSQPKLLMLDEPSMGLALLVKEAIADTVKSIREEGMTILLVEQDAGLAFGMADRVYVLEQGKIALHGLPENLMKNPYIKEIYLGLA